MPSNVVEVEQKREKWSFSRLTGWQLEDFESIESSGETAASFGELVP
jgi:hypothetical protein